MNWRLQQFSKNLIHNNDNVLNIIVFCIVYVIVGNYKFSTKSIKIFVWFNFFFGAKGKAIKILTKKSFIVAKLFVFYFYADY